MLVTLVPVPHHHLASMRLKERKRSDGGEGSEGWTEHSDHQLVQWDTLTIQYMVSKHACVLHVCGCVCLGAQCAAAPFHLVFLHFGIIDHANILVNVKGEKRPALSPCLVHNEVIEGIMLHTQSNRKTSRHKSDNMIELLHTTEQKHT